MIPDWGRSLALGRGHWRWFALTVALALRMGGSMLCVPCWGPIDSATDQAQGRSARWVERAPRSLSSVTEG